MSRLMIGLAMAVGLVGSVALGQLAGPPSEGPGKRPEPPAVSFQGGPAIPPGGPVGSFQGRPAIRSGRPAGSFPGGPAIQPEPGARGFSAAPGSRPESGPARRPSEPPDPRAPMVTVQALLVELVRDEEPTLAPPKPGQPARKPESPAPERKLDPGPRGMSELGLIDLDLAAPHEAILAELRKLGLRGRLEVLNRVQMTTLDKQPAYVQFGRQEPFIMGTTVTTFGQTNNVTLIQTGLVVGITPHVAPSDTVIMEIDLNQSRPGRLEDGKPIFVSTKGETVRQPSILRAQFQSTVKAPAGKTVVVVGVSESGPRRTETLLLVSAHVLKVQGE
jgi:hypothetical protein